MLPVKIIRTCVSALTMVTLSAGCLWAAPTLTADYDALQAFVNHGSAPSVSINGVLVCNSGSDLYFVNAGQKPLALKKIGSTGESGGALYRSFAISPDGRFVAIAAGSNKNIYLFPIQENAAKKLKVAEGTYPNFWIHPVSKANYVIYLDKTGISTMMQEFDPVTLETKGAPKLLVKAVHWWKTEMLDHTQQRYMVSGRLTLGDATYTDTVTNPNPLFYTTCKNYVDGDIRCEGKVTEDDLPVTGGRSADGRFLAGDDALHGVLELADPLATENAKISNYFWMTSKTGYWDFKSWTVTCPQAATSRTQIDNRLAGYCNGHISSSKKNQRFYGCVVHLGGGHTDLFVRQIPSNPASVQSAAHGPFDICQNGSICLPADTVVHITPCVGGSTYFNGPFWTQHKDFVISKTGIKKSDGTWEGVLFDIAGAPAYKHLKVFSKTLTGSDYVQAWFEDRESTSVQPQALTDLAHSGNRIRAMVNRSAVRVVAPGMPNGTPVSVVTLSGKHVGGGYLTHGLANVNCFSGAGRHGVLLVLLGNERKSATAVLTTVSTSGSL